MVLAYVGDLCRRPEERLIWYASGVVVPLTVGSCVGLEHVTGLSPEASPPVYTIRQIFLVVAVLGILAVVWWFMPRRDFDAERRLFAGEKRCPLCKQPLTHARLYRAVMKGAEEDARD